MDKCAFKQVVFDFGGVLIQWDPHLIASKFSSDDTIRRLALQDVLTHPEWLELDKGNYSEHDFKKRVSERSALSADDLSRLLDTVRLSFDCLADVRNILEILLETNVPCFGLSNMSVENWEFLRDTYSFFDALNGVVISGQEGTIKPNAQIYNTLIDRYKFDPKDTLFIDDTLLNCEAAESMGFQTFHFKNNPDKLTQVLSYGF